VIYVSEGTNNSVFLYTTLEVLDSAQSKGPPLVFNMSKSNEDFVKTQIKPGQCLRCSKSLVPQSAIIDSQTRQLKNSSLYPPVYKTLSTWRPSEDLDFHPEDTTLLGSDLVCYLICTDQDWCFSSGPIFMGSLISMVTCLDKWQKLNSEYKAFLFAIIWERFRYMMEYLDIDPIQSVSDNSSFTLHLHDIENALSSVVATLFWIGKDRILPHIRWLLIALQEGIFSPLMCNWITMSRGHRARIMYQEHLRS
jgi:hypothetical protein